MKREDLLKILLLWLLAAWVSLRIHPQSYTGGLSDQAQFKDQVNHSALGMMLGEFRTSLSEMFYMQTESYLHYGVAFLPHEDHEASGTEEMDSDLGAEAFAGTETAHHHDHDHEHEHEVLTVIPPADRDYRAWLGNLQREIKPWLEPGAAHRLSSDSEVVPYFRLMTLADPHYVKGYQVGAYWIGRLDVDAAGEFLAEGLRKNPKSFELYMARGFLELKKARRTGSGQLLDGIDPEQRRLMRSAKADFQRATDLMFRVRPSQAVLALPDHPEWSDDQESDAMAAVHMAVVLEERLGNERRAKELAADYLEKMPEHKQLRAFINGQ